MNREENSARAGKKMKMKMKNPTRHISDNRKKPIMTKAQKRARAANFEEILERKFMCRWWWWRMI